MKLSLKVGIGSLAAFLFIVIVGFVVFPKMIKSKVKSMVALKEGNDIRGMFIKVPFALDFRIYIFNVTNPMEIQEGGKPVVSEVGPFCFEEWKEKMDVQDNEDEDTMSYKQKDTFIPAMWPGCVDISTEVTIPHPMILGLVNTVMRQKPGAITLVNKAVKTIFKDINSIFLTAQAKDILFDGVIIHCGVKDFAGKAICSQLRSAGLPQVNDDDLAFSLFGAKNATPGKPFKVLRGIKDAHDLGRILTYDEKPVIENWSTKKCNEIHGTDGTIFPPLLTKEEGLVSFSPDLCRSLVAFYVDKEKYNGIPVNAYTANLGDASKNADEKCYCTTPETCLKKGLMDLYKCLGIPLYASLPHFYDCHESYLNGVGGLTPDKEKHEIKILFESTTGSPVYAKKRLQMNMPMEPNDKVDLFNKFPTTVFPIFWIEEGVELNDTFTKPLKDFFKIKKIVKFGSFTIMIGSLGGIAAAAYLFFKQSGEADVTPVSKVSPVNEAEKAIHNMKFSMNGETQGHINSALSSNEIDKY